MRTTISLSPEVYRLARAIAYQKHQSLGKVLGDALMHQFAPSDDLAPRLETDSDGFPVIYIGRPISLQEVAEAIEEDDIPA